MGPTAPPGGVTAAPTACTCPACATPQPTTEEKDEEEEEEEEAAPSPSSSPSPPSATPSPSPSPPAAGAYCAGAGSQPRPEGFEFDASICGNDRFHAYNGWLKHYDDKIPRSQCAAKTQPFTFLRYTDAKGRARAGFGFCDKDAKANAPEFGTIASEKMSVDFSALSPGDAGMAAVGEHFEAMHKLWGAGGDAATSGGVNKDNVFLGRRTLRDPATGAETTGTYLVLRAQGDLATSGSLAVKPVSFFLDLLLCLCAFH